MGDYGNNKKSGIHPRIFIGQTTEGGARTISAIYGAFASKALKGDPQITTIGEVLRFYC